MAPTIHAAMQNGLASFLVPAMPRCGEFAVTAPMVSPARPRGGWPAPLRNPREALKSWLFDFFGKVVKHDRGKRLLVESLGGGPRPAGLRLADKRQPYAELPIAESEGVCARTDVVFITARFRSGSTLLWNIFRHLPRMTAYYEPLNERRWFDPQIRGARVDPTHRQATEYWREYDGLEVLREHYREEWIDQRLFMDENAWDPNLKRYIEILIERAEGRPVLQFNRVDFRLPWLLKNFPHASLIHLYRNPRDQWCSTLMDLGCFGPSDDIGGFEPHDKFYLLRWARDLKYVFPFLDEKCVDHPYELFYHIWKLSYLFGATFAHQSIAFEDLTREPEPMLRRLVTALNMPDIDLNAALTIIERPTLEKWREYASHEWFSAMELKCERTLRDYFGSEC